MYCLGGFGNLFCPQSAGSLLFSCLLSGNAFLYTKVDLEMMVNTNKISGKDCLSPQLFRDL